MEDDKDSLQQNISGLSFRDLSKSSVDERDRGEYIDSFLFVNDDIDENTLFTKFQKKILGFVSRVKPGTLLAFFVDFFTYVLARFRILWVLLSVIFDIFVDISNVIKEKVVKKMFWGRGGFLQSTVQALLTIFVIILGVSYMYRRPVVTEASEGMLDTVGVVENDLIAANTSLTTLVPKDRGRLYTEEYVVKSGDTMSSIAKNFGLNVNTILWANDMDEDDYINPGDKLQIPQGDGVLITVEKGDTLASLAKDYDGNEQAIADANWLEYPFTLGAGDELFIPEGVMPEETVTVIASTPTYSYTYGSTSTSSYSVGTADSNVGKFLSWPVQGGAGTISQYYKGYYHRGVDIASSALPNVVAPASGTIIFAGCAPGCYCPALGSIWGGSGYAWSIQINHGNGYTTWYAHLSNIYVRSGQSVSAGTVIGKMGSTGRSTGPHLHWELRRGVSYGTDINPLTYLK